jgi:hypothetical protein
MTLLHRVLLPALAAGLLGGAGHEGASSSAFLQPESAPWVAPGPRSVPDTVRTATRTGTPLTLSLPDALDGHSVARYSLLRGPALSGVAGRSFTWIPEGTAPGVHHALLRAESTNTSPDTLVVQIRLRP